MSSIVGFSLNKMNIEKKKESFGKINITNNISIKDISDTKFAVGTASQSGVKFSFIFTSKYDPETAEILMEGNVLYMTEEADAKKILASWKKDKKFDPALSEILLNYILDRCNIEALILAKELNLPAPFPLPKLKQSVKAKSE